MFKLVRIPEAPMEILVQRILSYAGKLVVVKPKILKDKVREAAAAVLETHNTRSGVARFVRAGKA